MDDEDHLDETLSGLLGGSAIAPADEDSALRSVVERAHGKVRRRRLTAGSLAAAILAVIVIAVVAANGSHSSELQVQASPSSTLPTTTVSSSRVAATLPACPQVEPAGSPRTLNTGVHGLASKLVPIDVSSVRVCSYFNVGNGSLLDHSGLLTGQAAAAFERTANGLRLPPRLDITTCPGRSPWLITFANDTQRVTIGGYCGGVLSNGSFTISNSQKWFNELDLALTERCAGDLALALHNRLTCSPTRGTIRGTLRMGAPTRVVVPGCPTPSVAARIRCRLGRLKLGPQIPGTVIITAATGARRHATTSATRPFRVDLPPGIYHVTATAASVNGQSIHCAPVGPLMVLDGSGFDIPITCRAVAPEPSTSRP